MDLSEIREWFVQDSGRYDLVTDMVSFSDNGADRYINAGMRWLDRQVTILNQYGKFFRSVAAGDKMVNVSGCRSIRSAWIRDSDGNITKLTYDSFDDLREIFGEDFSEVTSGTPCYYTLLSLRQYDEQETDPPDDEGLTDDAWHTEEGILIMPPPDEAVTLIIEGKFRFATLADGSDENFWTVNEPSILVKAALRELEAFYRNTAGVQDWTNSIMADLFNIEKDYVEKAFGHYDQLEG